MYDSQNKSVLSPDFTDLKSEMKIIESKKDEINSQVYLWFVTK